MSIVRRLAVTTAGAAIVALGHVAPVKAVTLNNGSLSVDIRDDNGAIDQVLFGGSDFYNPGSPISNFGLQNGTDTSTFVTNTTDGFSQQPVAVIDNPGFVTVTGTYTGGGANINFNRTYSLVTGQDVLRIVTTFTNNGPDTTLSYFDTLDPDQDAPAGIFATFNDVSTLATEAGTATVGQASASSNSTSSGTPTLSVVLGSLDPNVTVASGNPFSIEEGDGLNSFFASPFDGNGTYDDQGTHIGIRSSLATGSTLSFTYDQAYGTTLGQAQAGFVAAQAVPFEISPGLGSAALGVCGAIAYFKDNKKRKISAKVFSKG